MLCTCVSFGQEILSYKKRNRLLCRQKNVCIETINDRKCWKHDDGICLLENDRRERENACDVVYSIQMARMDYAYVLNNVDFNK